MNVSRRSYVAAWAAAVLLGVSCVSCKSETDGADDAGGSKQTASDDPERADSGSDIADKRTAYGLPLPPKVADRREYERSIQVQTRMKLEEIIDFFRSHPSVTDYEILQPKDWKFRMVGLQEFMPEVEGYQYGPLVHLTYRPARTEPEPPEPAADEPDQRVRPAAKTDQRPDDPAASQRRSSEPWERSFNTAGSRKQGEPVRLETPEGELLAPGAKWGEPYTPPEGSPLHKDRYRSNFGRDFGDWRAP